MQTNIFHGSLWSEEHQIFVANKHLRSYPFQAAAISQAFSSFSAFTCCHNKFEESVPERPRITIYLYFYTWKKRPPVFSRQTLSRLVRPKTAFTPDTHYHFIYEKPASNKIRVSASLIPPVPQMSHSALFSAGSPLENSCVTTSTSS